ncbi:MAG: TetR family transcriptional regulator C-terminal domain-containing protein [Saccharofermentans sp.]|nr:TetR family transcriptional regulator C-terminal domain-containing protein [Saccharofermentans sp.]
MDKKPVDRRTLKTRKAIYDAMMELLTQKELHKVTVQEITDIADINRATFYKHYLDIYDLYDKLEQDILVEWGMLVLELQDLRSTDFFTKLVGYVGKNSNVFKMVFSPNAPKGLESKFERILDGLLKTIESERKGHSLKDIKLTYQTWYRSHGVIAVLTKWVEDGLDQPKEFVIKTLSELDSNTEKIM